MTVSRIDKIIRWLLYASAFLLPLAMSTRNFDAFDLTKATVFYILMALLLFFYVLRAMLKRELDYYKTPFLIPLVLYFVVAVVSVLFSYSPYASLFGEYGRYETLQVIGCYMLLLFFSTQFFRTEESQEKLLLLIFAAYFLITAYGIAQGFKWDLLPPFMQRPEARSRSTLGNAVFFGGYLATTLPLLFNGIFFKENIFFKNLKTSLKIPHYILIAVLVPLGIVASFFAESRGAWLGIMAGFLFLMFFRRRELKEHAQKLILLLVLGVMLSFFFLFTSSHGNVDEKVGYLVERAKSTVNILEGAKATGSGATRFEIWKSCLKMIKDRPLTGFGPDQTLYWFPRYRSLRYAKLEGEMTMPDRAHNEYLQVGVNLGIFGILIFIWMLMLWLLAVRRAIKVEGRRNPLFIGFVSAIVGYLVQAFFSISIIGLMCLLWIFMGATSIRSGEPLIQKRIRLSQGPRFIFAMLTLILSLVVIVFAARVQLADYYYYVTNRLSAEGKMAGPEETLAYYQTAVKLNPYRAIYRTALAQFYMYRSSYNNDRSLIELSIKTLEDEFKYNRYKEDINAQLASTYFNYAQNFDNTAYEAAEKYFRKTIEIDPIYRRARYGLIDILFTKQSPEALDEILTQINKILEIEENDFEAWFKLGAVYETKGDKKKANEAYNKALILNPGDQNIYNAVMRTK